MRKIALCLLWSLSVAPAARAQTVSYTVSIPKPTSSLLHVVMDIRGAATANVDVAMPAWSPGSYNLHWAAKNVQRFAAQDAGGRPLSAAMIDTSIWRIKPAAAQIRVSYDVYMGASTVNDTHATIVGTRCLMYLVGRAPFPAPGALTVTVEAPPGWRLATGLDAVRPGVFTAADYDTLVDAPIEASPELEVITFDHDQATYEIVIHARHNYDTARLRDDVRKIVAEEVRLMGGAPYKRYVFFFHGTNGGSGGLEHLNSTQITFGRYAQGNVDAYHRFQFVIAHEFYHLWNVKRIRPEILGPFDYSHPQHTRNLYVSEGMTSYFAALSLVRSGVWDRATFYDDLSKNIQELQTQPGHLLTSAEMSSWFTWNRPDNAANVTISYYTKGQILGTLLDLEMRGRTAGKKSLDDVFRQLLAEHGLPKPGFAEDGGFRGAVEKVAASGSAAGDFGDFFSRYVGGLDELPYDGMLAHAGLKLEVAHAPATRSIGVVTRTEADRLIVDSVPPSGAGYDAGLMPGDVVLALDDERVVPATFGARLNDRGAGAAVKLQVMRGDRLLAITVTLQDDHKPTYKITEDPAASSAARTLRDAWLKP
jgi:predicted metalloprotease with PDZ domain